MSVFASEAAQDQHVMPLRSWDRLLGSRSMGARVRQQALTKLQAQGRLTLDWEGVRAVSHSFADEFVGKLAEEIGVEQFRSRVQNRNMSPSIRPILVYVVAARLRSLSSPA